MSRHLNCWLVAMWLWLRSKGREYAWVRRTRSFLGLIPHFGYGERNGWRRVKVIEYIPPKNKLWSNEDWFFVFKGRYRVTYVRVMATRKFSTLEAATADRFTKVGCAAGAPFHFYSRQKENQMAKKTAKLTFELINGTEVEFKSVNEFSGVDAGQVLNIEKHLINALGALNSEKTKEVEG